MRSSDHNDADLILKLYDLRRETVMRGAREYIGFYFHPKSTEEVLKILENKESKENAYFRQVVSYWEMAASFVNQEILDPALFSINCSEGLHVYAKFEPFLETLRDRYKPDFFSQTEKAIRSHSVIQNKFSKIREFLQSKS